MDVVEDRILHLMQVGNARSVKGKLSEALIVFESALEMQLAVHPVQYDQLCTVGIINNIGIVHRQM